MSEEELEKHINYQWNIKQLEELAKKIKKHSELEEERFIKEDEGFNIQACFN